MTTAVVAAKVTQVLTRPKDALPKAKKRPKSCVLRRGPGRTDIGPAPCPFFVRYSGDQNCISQA